MNWARRAGLALATGALLAGCAGQQQAPPASAPTTGPAPATTSARPVPKELAFEATTVDGKPFSGASLLGRPAVLWFWAPWCPVCRQEAPEIAELFTRYGDRVQFVGVPGLDQVPEMRAFAERMRLSGFPHVVDRDGSLWTRFGVPGQPAFAWVHKDGRIEVTTAAVPKDIVAEKLDELLGE